MSDNFWEEKRVLVTGADGFIGSHLSEKLIALGANVSAYVRYAAHPPESVYFRNISHLKDKFETVIRGNIGNFEASKIIRKNNPEIIFHLAADAYVPHSFTNPLEVLESNVNATINVLEAALEIDVKQVVCTSSSEIYGTCSGPINENHPLNPTSPYAASKVAADRYAFSYWNTYNLPVAIIRPFNTYGPRHTYDVIPIFIDAALKNRPLKVNGSGEQTRDFMYVSDAVEGFLMMGAHRNAVGEAVNFGTQKDWSINNVAGRIIELSGSKSEIVHVNRRQAEVEKLLCDYSKARRLFGWEPKVSLEEGLKKNIEWTRKSVNF